MDNSYEYYNEIAKGYDELHKEEQLSKFRVINNTISIKSSTKILDVGCGTCLSYNFFTCDWKGIEPAKKMIQKNPNSKKLFEEKRVFVLPAESIKKLFNENEFDVIICVSTAHHFTNLEIVIKQMKKICKNNGDIVFSLLKTTNNCEKIKSQIKNNLKVKNTVDEGKDIILFCKNAL